MRKALLLNFVFLLILFKAPAQLTNRQVFNFNVGDVFECEAQNSGGPPTPPLYYLTQVTGKWYSITNDTIYYKEFNQEYQPPSCMSCSASYSSSIDTLLINNLDSLCNDFNFYMGNSCPLKDTLIGSGVCGKKIWKKYPDPKCLDTLFEPLSTSSWVIEGCGGGYFSGFDPTGPDGTTYSLIYYKKGTDSCGSYYVLGVNNIKQPAISVALFPNPNKGIFQLVISNYQAGITGSVEIYNMLGENIYSETLSVNNSTFNIDLGTKAPGVYMYRLVSETGEQIANGKFVIE